MILVVLCGCSGDGQPEATPGGPASFLPVEEPARPDLQVQIRELAFLALARSSFGPLNPSVCIWDEVEGEFEIDPARMRQVRLGLLERGVSVLSPEQCPSEDVPSESWGLAHFHMESLERTDLPDAQRDESFHLKLYYFIDTHFASGVECTAARDGDVVSIVECHVTWIS